jgi:hypothetical protein
MKSISAKYVEFKLINFIKCGKQGIKKSITQKWKQPQLQVSESKLRGFFNGKFL